MSKNPNSSALLAELEELYAQRAIMIHTVAPIVGKTERTPAEEKILAEMRALSEQIRKMGTKLANAACARLDKSYSPPRSITEIQKELNDCYELEKNIKAVLPEILKKRKRNKIEQAVIGTIPGVRKRIATLETELSAAGGTVNRPELTTASTGARPHIKKTTVPQTPAYPVYTKEMQIMDIDAEISKIINQIDSIPETEQDSEELKVLTRQLYARMAKFKKLAGYDLADYYLRS